MACTMEHTKTSMHKKKAATYSGQIIQCADVDLESYLEKIPKDESDRFWEKKSQMQGPVKQMRWRPWGWPPALQAQSQGVRSQYQW